MEIEKVTRSTYRLNDRTSKINVGLIVADDGVILVDTGSSLEMGSDIRRLVTEVAPGPVTHVISTHHHGEHTGGNAAFDTPIIASTACYHRMKGSIRPRLVAVDEASANPDSLSQGLPTLCFSDRGFLVLGTTVIELHQVPGDTEGSILVHLPEERVVFGGDAVTLDPIQLEDDSDVEVWIDSLRKISALAPLHVVPGRAEPFGPEGLESVRQSLEARLGVNPAMPAVPMRDAAGIIRLGSRFSRRTGSHRVSQPAKGAAR